MFDSKNIFLFGKKDFNKAIEAICKEFKQDVDEEECVTSLDINSCYNCLYRRWTKDSFICTKRVLLDK
ncbi:hypothetical protein [Arcobacter porcinus]|uniref:hypothetical protein n=1 Tax=Arcobacter porcinus TaxID=1935204 RepID=UPI00081EDF38|nr:hypothetical protein [Arcobacter porcinus]OCL84266.1 hypothetical protein AAW30_00640 [Arcobacter porcinus]OCL84786.1 hypothetical protein AAW29_00465 [Arcobacter porcinus]